MGDDLEKMMREYKSRGIRIPDFDEVKEMAQIQKRDDMIHDILCNEFNKILND